MQKVLTAAEMREVDRLTTERYGIPSIILMENAAHAVAGAISEKLGRSPYGKAIMILCGKGNNGGDGAALARVLWELGARVEIFLFGKVNDTKGDARTNFEFLSTYCSGPIDLDARAGSDTGRLTFVEDPDPEWFRNIYQPSVRPHIVVDALLGTGIDHPIDGRLRDVVNSEWLAPKLTREKDFSLISVDLPSGLNADVAQPIGSNVEADITVTFTAPKPANVLAPARRFNGQLTVANIGTPRVLVNESKSLLFLSEKSDVTRWMSEASFSSDSYKNKRGHALIIAGSENYSGAAVLCGNAAIRSGVGLVTIGTPRSSRDIVGGQVVPEVMVRPLAETKSGAVSKEAIEEIENFWKNAHAIAIGAGLSTDDESTRRLVRHFVENRIMPTILDADALTLMAPFERVGDGPPVILTPHEGEFMRLLGTDDKEAIKDRVASVQKFTQEKNVILVLKGERNLVGHPDGRVVVNPTGNSGLGKAGNGDTLLGIITGFVAQAASMDIEIFDTVVAAVYVAGLAGDIAAEKYGKRVMTASDTRDCLAEAFLRCETEN